MGDEFYSRPDSLRQQKRRKSFFRRIADSISSLVPSTIFPSHSELATSCDRTEYQPEPVISAPSIELGKKPHEMRDCDTQTLTVLDNCGNLDVDLDALEHSDDQMSAHSSTSGVSSLLPRSVRCKLRDHPPNTYSALPTDFMNDIYCRTSATCSDAADSINSASTFHPVTPWVFSSKDQPDSLGSERPTKRQRLSSIQSNCSSNLDNLRSSLFYQSKTTYGGAASCRLPNRRRDLFGTTVPLRFELESKATSMGSTSMPVSGPNLSSTARRILESLERFSTPLATADRIPTPVHSQHSAPVLPKKSFRTHRFPPYMQAYNHLKTVQRRKADTSGTIPYSPEVLSSVRTTTSQYRPASDGVELPPSTAPLSMSFGVKLSESVNTELGFQHLPLLTTPRATAVPVPSTTAPSVIVSHSPPNVSAESSTAFTFAPPLKRPSSIASRLAVLSPLELPSKYEFSAPERLSRSSSSTTLQSNWSTGPLTIQACSQLSKSHSSPIFDMIMSSTETRRCSPTSFQGEIPSLPSESMWRCETCLLENPESSDKCVACSMPRMKETLRADKTGTSPSNSSIVSSKWECPVCMIFNEQEIPECIACKAKRPTSSSTVSTNVPSLPVSNKTNLSNKWECPTCMVFNESVKTSCVCCQTAKPGVKVERLPVEASSVEWECPTCMVKNSATKLSCPCCSTPKPNASQSSSAADSTFGLPTPATSFPIKFGLFNAQTSQAGSTPSTTSVGSNFSFGLKPVITSSHSDLSNAEKPLEPLKSSAPVFTFGMPPSVGSQLTPVSTVSFSMGTSSVASSTSSSGFVFSPCTASNVVSSTTSVSSSTPVLNFGSLGKRGSPSDVPPATADFKFGLPSVSKPPVSTPNGLVNGGTVELFTSKSAPAFKFFATQSGSSKDQTVPFNFSSQPSAPFSFGATTTVPGNVPFTVPLSTSADPSVLPKLGSFDSLSAPTFTSTAGGPFCFGNAGKSSASSGDANPQSFVFGQSASQPAGNMFSVSSSTAPRKKAHAVRRFQR